MFVGFADTFEMDGGVVSGGGGGGGGGAGLTTMVTCFLAVPPQPVAVSVYVRVVPGLTVLEPGVGTPPMSGSIAALVALVTAPQLSVLDWPTVIVLGLTVKNAITGGPGHTGGCGGGGCAGLTTTVTCFIVVPPQPTAVSVKVVVFAG